MSYSGGTFSINSSGQPVVTGTVISSTAFNALTSDLASGLSTCLLKDGTQTLTANIPFGGFKITGLAAGSSNGDSLRYEQLIGAYLPIGGGTLTGNLLFTDATYDIGASGATRPRDLFLSRNAVIGGTEDVAGNFSVATNKFTVAAASGNTVVAGTLGVTGVATLASPVINTGVSGSAIAAQSDQETGTSVVTIVTPGRQQFHQSAAKATAGVNQASGTAALFGVTFNISSVTDGATGVFTLNFTTSFSGTTYYPIARCGSEAIGYDYNTRLIGSLAVTAKDITTGNPIDKDDHNFAFFGDQ